MQDLVHGGDLQLGASTDSSLLDRASGFGKPWRAGVGSTSLYAERVEGALIALVESTLMVMSDHQR